MRPLLALLLVLPAAADDDPWTRRAKADCESMTRRIEAFLGPKFKAPVPVSVEDTEFIAPFVRRTAKKWAPEGSLEAMQRAAVRLHQVPPGCDIVEQQIKLLEKGVAGLYDPDDDRFYVFRGIGPPGTPEFLVTVAHELVHAYRDVDTGFWKRELDAVAEDLDWALAMQFLVEGDATLLGLALGTAAVEGRDTELLMPRMLERSREESRMIGEMSALPEFAEFPLVLREAAFGPYAWGTPLAILLYERGGLTALADAYARPPRSTEQVLHLSKYVGPEVDEPTVLTGGNPVDALGPGWSLTFSNVMGEFDLRVHLTELLGKGAAETAAAGWDGSRFHFCEKPGAPAFFGMVTTWDREEDATEFAIAWAAWAAKRDGRGDAPATRGDVETDEGLVVVRVQGRDVVVADGVPRDRVEAVVAALSRVERAERKPDAVPAGVR